MKDVLIIRSKCMLKPEQLYKVRKGIEGQINTGVVVIPEWFDVELINVPDDIQVIVENKSEETV